MASYSEVDVGIVRKACEAYLANRERHIQALQDCEIEREMRPYNLLGFRFGAKTREQAIKELEKGRWNTYNLIRLEGAHWAHKVRELLALCKVAGVSTVKLTAEDAGTLQRFFE